MDLEEHDSLDRYSIIDSKNKREIVLLRGAGCVWKKCTFCDYHDDFSKDKDSNFLLNKEVLDKVSGIYKKLEIINSGSFCELDNNTKQYILDTCKKNDINEISVELHWSFRNEVAKIKEFFAPIYVNFKIGIETFDIDFRERVMKKGMGDVKAEDIKKYFQDCCLLIGIQGQTREQVKEDISIAMKNFNRVCINVFVENTTDTKRDDDLVKWFVAELYDEYKNNERIDILIQNTDFGVGS